MLLTAGLVPSKYRKDKTIPVAATDASYKVVEVPSRNSERPTVTPASKLMKASGQDDTGVPICIVRAHRRFMRECYISYSKAEKTAMYRSPHGGWVAESWWDLRAFARDIKLLKFYHQYTTEPGHYVFSLATHSAIGYSPETLTIVKKRYAGIYTRNRAYRVTGNNKDFVSLIPVDMATAIDATPHSVITVASRVRTGEPTTHKGYTISLIEGTYRLDDGSIQTVSDHRT